MWGSVLADIPSLTTIQQLASTCFYCAGIIGVVTGLLALWSNRRNQRESNARRAYFDYTRAAEAKPTFAFPPNAKINVQDQTINESQQEFEQYEWFISSLLTTVTYILETHNNDRFWRRLMILQIAYHWRYFEYYRNKKQFLITWELELKEAFNEGIALGKREYS